jgi:hypothetical protein
MIRERDCSIRVSARSIGASVPSIGARVVQTGVRNAVIRVSDRQTPAGRASATPHSRSGTSRSPRSHGNPPTPRPPQSPRQE